MVPRAAVRASRPGGGLGRHRRRGAGRAGVRHAVFVPRLAPDRPRARTHTRRVFLFDFLGYGQSEKRDGQDVSLGVQNGLLAALLQHWGLSRADLIAHDFGGATALRAHLLNGCDYRRLLLLDAVAIRPWGSPFVQHVRRHEAAFSGMPDFLQRAVLEAYIRTAAARHLGDDELAPYVEPWLGPLGQPAFYRQIAQMDLRYTDEV